MLFKTSIDSSGDSHSLLNTSRVCENCRTITEKLAALEEALAVNEEILGKQKLELDHTRIILEQQRILNDKRTEELKHLKSMSNEKNQAAIDQYTLNKDKEIQDLKNKAKQRDDFLQKARKLVLSLSEECNKKTLEIEELKKLAINNSENSNLSKDNQDLKAKLKDLESKLEHFKISRRSEEDSNKPESFSFDNESFSSKVQMTNARDAACHKLEQDIGLLEAEVNVLKQKSSESQEENRKLIENLRSLERVVTDLQQEKAELTMACSESKVDIENYRYRVIQLESELKSAIDCPKYNQSLEDLTKVIVQKESMITELTSQVLRTNKHQKHRRNSYLKEIFELGDAIKTEIKFGKEEFNELSKDAFQVFKEFQFWYREYKTEQKLSVLQEILMNISSCSKGKTRNEISEILKSINCYDYNLINQRAQGVIMLACCIKDDSYSKLKAIKDAIDMSIESIEVVTTKLKELQKNMPSDNSSAYCMKVIDLMLGFLKNFAKEREQDYESCCEILTNLA